MSTQQPALFPTLSGTSQAGLNQDFSTSNSTTPTTQSNHIDQQSNDQAIQATYQQQLLLQQQQQQQQQQMNGQFLQQQPLHQQLSMQSTSSAVNNAVNNASFPPTVMQPQSTNNISQPTLQHTASGTTISNTQLQFQNSHQHSQHKMPSNNQQNNGNLVPLQPFAGQPFNNQYNMTPQQQQQQQTTLQLSYSQNSNQQQIALNQGVNGITTQTTTSNPIILQNQLLQQQQQQQQQIHMSPAGSFHSTNLSTATPSQAPSQRRCNDNNMNQNGINTSLLQQQQMKNDKKHIVVCHEWLKAKCGNMDGFCQYPHSLPHGIDIHTAIQRQVIAGLNYSNKDGSLTTIINNFNARTNPQLIGTNNLQPLQIPQTIDIEQQNVNNMNAFQRAQSHHNTNQLQGTTNNNQLTTIPLHRLQNQSLGQPILTPTPSSNQQQQQYFQQQQLQQQQNQHIQYQSNGLPQLQQHYSTQSQGQNRSHNHHRDNNNQMNHNNNGNNMGQGSNQTKIPENPFFKTKPCVYYFFGHCKKQNRLCPFSHSLQSLFQPKHHNFIYNPLFHYILHKKIPLPTTAKEMYLLLISCLQHNIPFYDKNADLIDIYRLLEEIKPNIKEYGTFFSPENKSAAEMTALQGLIRQTTNHILLQLPPDVFVATNVDHNKDFDFTTPSDVQQDNNNDNNTTNNNNNTTQDGTNNNTIDTQSNSNDTTSIPRTTSPINNNNNNTNNPSPQTPDAVLAQQQALTVATNILIKQQVLLQPEVINLEMLHNYGRTALLPTICINDQEYTQLSGYWVKTKLVEPETYQSPFPVLSDDELKTYATKSSTKDGSEPESTDKSSPTTQDVNTPIPESSPTPNEQQQQLPSQTIILPKVNFIPSREIVESELYELVIHYRDDANNAVTKAMNANRHSAGQQQLQQQNGTGNNQAQYHTLDPSILSSLVDPIPVYEMKPISESSQLHLQRIWGEKLQLLHYPSSDELTILCPAPPDVTAWRSHFNGNEHGHNNNNHNHNGHFNNQSNMNGNMLTTPSITPPGSTPGTPSLFISHINGASQHSMSHLSTNSTQSSGLNGSNQRRHNNNHGHNNHNHHHHNNNNGHGHNNNRSQHRQHRNNGSNHDNQLNNGSYMNMGFQQQQQQQYQFPQQTQQLMVLQQQQQQPVQQQQQFYSTPGFVEQPVLQYQQQQQQQQPQFNQFQQQPQNNHHHNHHQQQPKSHFTSTPNNTVFYANNNMQQQQQSLNTTDGAAMLETIKQQQQFLQQQQQKMLSLGLGNPTDMMSPQNQQPSQIITNDSSLLSNATLAPSTIQMAPSHQDSM